MVSEKPMRSLCPRLTPGIAGSPAPITSSPGAVRWAMYRSEGCSCVRCGSLARMARPVVVRDGARAQLLLPVPSRAARSGSAVPMAFGSVASR